MSSIFSQDCKGTVSYVLSYFLVISSRKYLAKLWHLKPEEKTDVGYILFYCDLDAISAGSSSFCTDKLEKGLLLMLRDIKTL